MLFAKCIFHNSDFGEKNTLGIFFLFQLDAKYKIYSYLHNLVVESNLLYSYLYSYFLIVDARANSSMASVDKICFATVQDGSLAERFILMINNFNDILLTFH